MRDDSRLTAHADAGALLRKTAHGAGWVVGWRMARRGLGFVSTLILARLLLPHDFGLVALASGVRASLGALSSIGIEEALVRAKDPRPALMDTGFTLNVLRGTVTAAVLAIAARPAAALFGDARLIAIIEVLALGALIESFTNIGVIHFRRALAFEKEFVLLIVPRVLGSLVTVGVAIATRSYWALVAGSFVSTVAAVVASYWMHSYRPHLTLCCWRELFHFSAWIWLSGLAQMLRERMDQFILGRSLGEGVVGSYSLAWELAHLPASEMVGPLARASYSSIAVAHHANMDVGKMYLRVLAATSLVILPAAVGASAVASALVRVLLGPHWTQTAPLMAAASPFAVFLGIGLVTSSTLTALGMTRALFLVTAPLSILQAAMLVLLIPTYGATAGVIVVGCVMVLDTTFFVGLAMRRLKIRAGRIARIVWRPIVGTAAMAGALHTTGLGWHPGSLGTVAALLCLLRAIPLGVAAFCAVLLVLWQFAGRPETAGETDLINLLAARMRRRRTSRCAPSAVTRV